MSNDGAVRGSVTQRHAARWALVLEQLIVEAGGAPNPPTAAGAGSETGDLAPLAEAARALLPQVFEDRVRQVLEALISANGGAPAAPAAGAAPTPQGTLPAPAR